MTAAPYVPKQAPKKETNPLIEKRPKNFGIGMYICISALYSYLWCDVTVRCIATCGVM